MTKVTSQIKMVIKRLEILNKVPIDIEKHILDILQTSSVSKYTLFFLQLQMNLKKIPSLRRKHIPAKIITLENLTYRELLDILV